MNEEKTIGDICHDAFWFVSGDEVYPKSASEAWEAAASAVWDKAVEECADMIEKLRDNPQQLKLYMGEMEVQEQRTLKAGMGLFAFLLRSLKCSQDDNCQAKPSASESAVSAPAEPHQADIIADAALKPTIGIRTNAMKHLGEVLNFFANLDEGDRCRSFEEAVEFYNKHNPDSRIQGEPGFTWYICQRSPLGFNCRHQIEEPANAGDEVTAASAESSLTPINQDQDNG